ncbi:MAG: biopolymer transporter ExbD [Planctomycetota bacterium]
MVFAAAAAEEPPLPESTAAQTLDEVQQRASWLEIFHSAADCAEYASSPSKCLKADHWTYRMGEETFALAEPPAGATGYVPLSEGFTKHIAALGKQTDDPERPGLSTTEIILYTHKQTPARLLVDGFITSAMAGRVWRLYVACSTGLLPLTLPIDRGVMPAVPREGTALEVRVAIFLDPATKGTRYQVEKDAAPTSEELEKALKKSYDHLKERFPSVSFPLILEAAPTAPFQAIVDVVTTARAIGYEKVQLAVPGR